MARKMTRKDVSRILRLMEIEKICCKDRIWDFRKKGIKPDEGDVERVKELTELIEVFGEYMKKQDLRRQ